jgi:hypothetical protein
MTTSNPEADDGRRVGSERPLDDATRAADRRDAGARHGADRAPTPEEERIADEVATDVDPSSADHYREMAEIGADVEGEGRIEP